MENLKNTITFNSKTELLKYITGRMVYVELSNGYFMAVSKQHVKRFASRYNFPAKPAGVITTTDQYNAKYAHIKFN